MTIYSLRHSSVRPQTLEWLKRVLEVLDAKDVDGYLSFCCPSLRVSFNNDEPARFVGLEEARKGFEEYWKTFQTIEHEELNIYSAGTGQDGASSAAEADEAMTTEDGGDRFFMHEALNHFVTLDGRKVTIKAVAFIDRDRQGRIEQLRVYSDQTPLWADLSK